MLGTSKTQILPNGGLMVIFLPRYINEKKSHFQTNPSHAVAKTGFKHAELNLPLSMQIATHDTQAKTQHTASISEIGRRNHQNLTSTHNHHCSLIWHESHGGYNCARLRNQRQNESVPSGSPRGRLTDLALCRSCAISS